MSEIDKGSITLERFGQNTDNVRDSLIGAARDLALAESKLPAFREAVAKMIKAGDAKQVAAAKTLLEVEESRVKNLSYIIAGNRETLDYLLAQEDSIKAQVELTQFLKDQGKGVMSEIVFGFEVAKASAENATVAALDYYTQILAVNKLKSEPAAKYETDIKSLLDANKSISDIITTAQRQAIMSASTERMADVEAQLRDIEGVTVDAVKGIITIGTTPINVISQASQDALTVVGVSADAMKKLSQDAYLEAISLAKELGKTIASTILDVAKELRTIEQDKVTTKIKFDIDKLNISMTAAKAAREFNIAFLANQIKMTELKVDLKKVKPIEGANQINIFESKILAEKRALIEDERRISQEIYDKELVAAINQNARDKEKISLEIQTKRDAIAQDYAVLTTAAVTYNTIARKLHTALIDGGNTLGQTLVDALNVGIKSFVGSLGPVAKALGIIAQPGTFTPASAPSSTAEDAALAAITSNIAAAVKEAEDNLDKLEAAQLDYSSSSLNMELDLMGKKRIAQEIEFDRQIMLLAQQENISKLEAEKRLKDAGGKEKDKLQNRIKELFDSFTSSVESAFMSLYNLAITGEGSIREIIGGLFSSIAEEVFKQTIATPLSNIIAGWVTGAITKILPTDIVGSSLQGVVGSATGATGDALLKNTMGEAAVDAGARAAAAAANAAAVSAAAATVSTAYTTAGTTVAVAATAGIVPISTAGVTIAGGITTLAATVAAAASAALIAINAAKVSSTFSSGIGSAITTLVAGGGMIHRAGGGSVPGYASGNMVRDRVPAMLEPGEFVLRKQAASAIGVPALQAMNAGGAAVGNVVVNIKNEGTPQDATASTPRFDGEKFVIDIITRDLSNNGPIRRSMRAGS
jgi:hypothetical protein